MATTAELETGELFGEGTAPQIKQTRRPQPYDRKWQQKFEEVVRIHLHPQIHKRGLPISAAMTIIHENGLPTTDDKIIRHALWRMGYGLRLLNRGDRTNPFEGEWKVFPDQTIDPDSIQPTRPRKPGRSSQEPDGP